MKRIFCLLLAACMMLSLCACGKGREKDAGNDTLSSNEEASASAESIPTPKEQETPGESEPSQPYAGKVDVDLTVLSSTMVYSEVYNMLYNDPAHYLGKTVKARGGFSIYQLVTDGVLQPDGRLMAEARMDVAHVGSAIVYMANLPLDTNVLFMTVMANKMPFVGRG